MTNEMNCNFTDEKVRENLLSPEGMWKLVDFIAESVKQFVAKRPSEDFVVQARMIILTILSINVLPRYQRTITDCHGQTHQLSEYQFSRFFNWLIEPEAVLISVDSADAIDLRQRFTDVASDLSFFVASPAEIFFAEQKIAADFKRSVVTEEVDRAALSLEAAIAQGLVVDGKVADGHQSRCIFLKNLGLYEAGHYYTSLEQYLIWKIAEVTKRTN